MSGEINKLEQFFRDPTIGEGLLRPGISGKACENIRHALRMLGYHQVEYGDKYDDQLAKVVLQFQTDNDHRSRDGFFGPGTRKLLVQKLVEARHTYIFQRMRTPEVHYLEEKIAYYHELIKVLDRRHNALELQAAGFGMYTPPYVKIEMEDISKEIQRYKQMRDEAEKELATAKSKVD